MPCGRTASGNVGELGGMDERKAVQTTDAYRSVEIPSPERFGLLLADLALTVPENRAQAVKRAIHELES